MEFGILWILFFVIMREAQITGDVLWSGGDK